MTISATSEPFGTVNGGQPVQLVTLHDKDTGVTVKLTNYGATIVSFSTPDSLGLLGDVVLGYDKPIGYESDTCYFGPVVGRVANRINQGKFTIDGAVRQVTVNRPPHHLHGGAKGFSKKVWEVVKVDPKGAVCFGLTSADGDEGYPGTLLVDVTYILGKPAAGEFANSGFKPLNTLSIVYHASSIDSATPINLTNHSYFNLSAGAQHNIHGHHLHVNADSITAVTSELIPTGEIKPVKDTPFDLTEGPLGVNLGERFKATEMNGFDHNFVLNGFDKANNNKFGAPLRTAARLSDPGSGRALEVKTTSPGIQVYTGNFLSSVPGRNGAVYGKHGAVALETQHFPDSVNHANFPSTVCNAFENWDNVTSLTVGVLNK
ncbi:aldose 1-epimerase [Capsaspora owczarzaki ATCC 30864]|uniref:Aldose 1-epimerase n=1 Tax=Capsaspora owczarzaki (strain ATCC 30864) TaxID=595528 RepID=A0A0D2UC05_CAPO3|nr:aldose 1-epimerase [Capsaspora owczarzaki ATCC 30864]KJE92551.1 aldose 1-epimerase [Capsaspora owczarzaki ATCC 30864]|eukprot:XP_004348402.2 aldose 1-epimerase [Capsaspora owczarzaki ATCC 30864]